MSLSFTEHPASVGETYWQHLRSAAGFAGGMLIGAPACLIHTLLPFVFVRTGSSIIEDLHRRMVLQRHRQQSAPATSERFACNR